MAVNVTLQSRDSDRDEDMSSEKMATLPINNSDKQTSDNNNTEKNGHKIRTASSSPTKMVKIEMFEHDQKDEKTFEYELDNKKGGIIFGYRASQIKWFNVFWLIFVHVLAIVGYCYVSLEPVKFWTVWWIIFVALLGGFGVSAGAHRLYAHRSYKASPLLRLMLVVMETFSMNGGCYSYARDHRCHHKFVDTNGDPKNAKRGFFFAHLGWWMLKKHPEVFRKGAKLNHQDLDDDWMIVWQKKLYFPLFFLFGVVVATIVPIYGWGEDPWVAFFMGGVLRTVVVIHHLFTVNSIAHIWGKRPYNTDIGPTESKITMYLSMGEGSHNYHHTFPTDYANCEKKWWEVFNPSTLFLDICELLGLAHDLKKPSHTVVKGVVGRKGDPGFYERKLFRELPLSTRIWRGAKDWATGIAVAGWAIYPPILFKIVTDRPLFVF